MFPRLPTPSGTPEGQRSIGNRSTSTRLRPTRRAGPSSPKSSKSPGRASDVACHYAARIRSRGRVGPLKIYCGLPTDIPGGQVNFPGVDSAPGTKSSPSTDPRIVKPKVFSKGRCPDPKKLVAYRPMVCPRRLVGRGAGRGSSRRARGAPRTTGAAHRNGSAHESQSLKEDERVRQDYLNLRTSPTYSKPKLII